ncbi:MAG TPA: signal peptide peptidase SppA [Blastocatellia bacterium]|nr:signal peptide peptidase SppA [Blastocatellia bacterium]
MRLIGSRNNRVAVVRVEGIISDSDGFGASRMRVIQQLKIADQKRARAVVVRVNSPGGTVAACQEIFTSIDRLKRRGIPVVASLGDVAASGGVYVAMAADEIVTNPGTVTGSIGVIIRSSNLSDLYRRVGVSPKVVKSGPHKDMLSTYRALSDEEQTLLQQLIEDSHNQFVDVIVASRKCDRAAIERIADGRILTGRQALEAGLVDFLGDLDAAVERAAARGGIEGKPRVVFTEPRRRPWRRLLGPFGASIWQPSLPMWIMPNI